MTKEDIARTAYNVNRAYCESLGDYSFGPWEEAPEWQKNSNRLGVDFHMANPGTTAAASHEAWLALKTEEGWKYAANQQAKDYLFKAVVDSLRELL